MIGRLDGTCVGTTPDGAAVIDVGGVGYSVHVTAPTLTRLIESTASTFPLFIHTAVREDAIDLYGFETGEELVFFKQLTSVSGIGPKSALGILNLNDVEQLTRTIMQGDATALTRVHGIGKKSAERIVVELRDKVTGKQGDAGGPRGVDAEVVDALLALGYRVEEARSALKEIGVTGTDISARVATALKYLGSQQSR